MTALADGSARIPDIAGLSKGSKARDVLVRADELDETLAALRDGQQ